MLFTLKTNQKKCFNKNCRVTIKITKGINNSRFFDYQSVVSNDFYQINALKEIRIKNLQKGYCYTIDYKE